MKKILIIGNGFIFKNYEDLYKTSNLILRFNNPRLLGAFDDGKTDYLSIVDTGNPALIFLLQIKNKVNNTFFKIFIKSKNIIFCRNSEIHKNHFLRNKNFFYKSHLESHLSIADLFLPELKYYNKRVIIVDKKINNYCFEKLEATSEKKFICPSTGFITLNYFLTNKKFKDYEKHLVGFSFKGWKGHPWAAESLIIKSLAADRKLILHENKFIFKLLNTLRTLFYKSR